MLEAEPRMVARGHWLIEINLGILLERAEGKWSLLHEPLESRSVCRERRRTPPLNTLAQRNIRALVLQHLTETDEECQSGPQRHKRAIFLTPRVGTTQVPQRLLGSQALEKVFALKK